MSNFSILDFIVAPTDIVGGDELTIGDNGIIANDGKADIGDELIIGGDDNDVDSNGEIIVGGGIVSGDIAEIPTKITECSLVSRGEGGVCSSDVSVKAVAEVLKNTHSVAESLLNDSATIITVAKEKMNCDSEACVLAQSEVVSQAGKDVIKKELETSFKLNGPTDVSLLSNVNLDGTLRQWQIAYNEEHPDAKFYVYNFNMVDFKEHGDTLETVDIVSDVYKAGYRTAACIINTDRYSGRGIHWMALFVDMRADDLWSVEFFNSAGNAPQKSYAEWLLKTKSDLEKIDKHPPIEIVRCIKVRHQNSRTECGVYSLYYVWARLMKDIPFAKFMESRISDQVMFEFRQHLFVDNKNGTIKDERGVFDLRAFFEKCRPKWEDGKAPKMTKTDGGYVRRVYRRSRKSAK